VNYIYWFLYDDLGRPPRSDRLDHHQRRDLVLVATPGIFEFLHYDATSSECPVQWQ
jgi:hypothetical protein